MREHKKDQFQKLEITIEQNIRSMLPAMSPLIKKVYGKCSKN